MQPERGTLGEISEIQKDEYHCHSFATPRFYTDIYNHMFTYDTKVEVKGEGLISHLKIFCLLLLLLLCAYVCGVMCVHDCSMCLS